MKEEKKIAIEQMREGLGKAMKTPISDEEWENLLFGWRHKTGKQKAYTDKGWLSLNDAQSLEEYAGYKMVNQ